MKRLPVCRRISG